jgi:hypothetical protein
VYRRKHVEERLSSPFALPVLSLTKEACRRVRIEKRFEERVRIEKTIYGLERPFLLRQAQYERKYAPLVCFGKFSVDKFFPHTFILLHPELVEG